MAHVYAPDRSRASVSLRIPEVLFGYAVLLLIGSIAIFAIHRMSTAMPVSAGAGASEFSTGRAMQHLTAIAQTTRPMGSAAHEEVRDYIVGQLTALGLKPEIQKASSVVDDGSLLRLAATVQNIVVKVKGASNSKAVMLIGHYDSMPNSLGASDDGSAVAAMLETARALLASPALKNDVILLFTDGEEPGMLGAKAFIDDHRWANDVGLALNFDALGSGGPLILFETGDQNGWVVQEFARIARHPVGNSLANDIYKFTPYGTDLDAFKKAGYAGLNFAYVGRPAHHHALSDSVDNIDQGTVQEIGSYALSLTRHFGELDLREVRKPDEIYFDVFGLTLFHYSKGAGLALAGTVFILFIGVASYGFKRGKLNRREATFGFLIFLANLIAVPLITAGVWMAVWLLNGRQARFNSELLMLGFAALAIAFVAECYILCEKKIGIENLAFGALSWWLILTVATIIVVPGGSYLFSWPLLFAIAGLAILFANTRDGGSKRRIAAISILSIPAIALFLPLTYLTYSVFGLESSAAITVAIVFMLGPLVPQVKLLSTAKEWTLPAALGLAGLILIISGSFTSHLFNEQSPKQNNVFYVLNSDNGKALWASYDHDVDEWTSQYLGKAPQRGPLVEYLPTSYPGFFSSPAPAFSLEGPRAMLLSATTEGDTRTIRLRITSPRKAPLMAVYVTGEAPLKKLTIDGKPISNLNSRAGFNYFGLPPEGIEVTVETSAAKPIKVRALDQSYELPEIPGSSFKPRAANMIPAVVPYSDVTLVSKSFKF